MLRINGREIFQQERVDKGYRRIGNESREAFSKTGSFGWSRESSHNEWDDGGVGEAWTEGFAGLERF